MAARNKRRGRRNRKKRKVHVGFPSPLAAVLLSVAALALVYLWLCGRCEALGKDITALEKKQEKVHGRVLNEQYKWSNMKSPRSMEFILKKHRLVMVLPAEKNVVRVRAAEMESLAEEGAGQPRFAQHAGAFMND